jgi:hypothetical protein
LTNPDFKRHHRLFFTKKALVKKYPQFINTEMTEYEIAKSLGFERIWDCGHARWLWSNPI